MTEKQGFHYFEVAEGEAFRLPGGEHNRLLFLLEGGMQVSCNGFYRRHLQAGRFVLVPVAADTLCRTLAHCRMAVFAFDALPATYNGLYMTELWQAAKGTPYTFSPLPIHTPLQKFLLLLERYLKDGMTQAELQKIKYQEFFFLLQAFYGPRETAGLLHPLIGSNHAFRMEVLRHYRQADSIEGLAALLGLRPRTFGRFMQEEFGVSPYQWMLARKAQHVYFSLMEEPEKSLETIRLEHGFLYAGHFTRFCKEQLGDAPLKLRRKFKESKMIN